MRTNLVLWDNTRQTFPSHRGQDSTSPSAQSCRRCRSSRHTCCKDNSKMSICRPRKSVQYRSGLVCSQTKKFKSVSIRKKQVSDIKRTQLDKLIILFPLKEQDTTAAWRVRTYGCWCKLWCWHILWIRPQRWPRCPAERDPIHQHLAERRYHRTPTGRPFASSRLGTFPISIRHINSEQGHTDLWQYKIMHFSSVPSDPIQP